MDQPNFFGDYDTLLELVRNRVSVRKLKSDPIPDEYVEKILEIGRWAMSGANGQPWEFVVVKDPKIKAELFRVYVEENVDFIYWMEQQRDLKLRHPAYQMTQEATVAEAAARAGLVAGAGTDRDPRRRPSPVGDRAGCPHLRARSVASHRHRRSLMPSGQSRLRVT